MEATIALPKGAEKFIEELIIRALAVLKQAKERELHRWGQGVLKQFKRREVKSSFRSALRGWASELSGPRIVNGNRRGEPVAYALLMDECDALNDRMLRMSSADVYEPADHVLDIGEVALGSLKDAVESYPLAKGIISVIQELITIAKAIAKRVRAGW